MPGLPVHHKLPEFTQTHVHWVGDTIQPSHPLSSLLLLPPIPPSIRVFSNESTLHMRWPNYWSFSFNMSPSNEHPGLISFRMDGLDLRAVQGTLKSLLQHPRGRLGLSILVSRTLSASLVTYSTIRSQYSQVTYSFYFGTTFSLLWNMEDKMKWELSKETVSWDVIFLNWFLTNNRLRTELNLKFTGRKGNIGYPYLSNGLKTYKCTKFLHVIIRILDA